MNNQTPQETKAVQVRKEYRRKGAPDEDTRKRRDEVFRSMQLTGGYGVPVYELAQRHNVVPRTIYKDMALIMKNIPRPEIDLIAKKFKMSFESILSQATKMLYDSDKIIQKNGAELILKTAVVYTDILEKYGFKDKVADKLEIDQLHPPVNITIIRDSEIVNNNLELHNDNIDTSSDKR